jgi:hypothetical protein
MKQTRAKKLSKGRHKAISVESGHLEGPWQGHYPVTCVAMMAMMDRASAGDQRFSPAERILFVACEFWAAHNAAELDAYFDLKAPDPTRDARVALRIVGAAQLANALDQGVLGPPGGRASAKRKKRLVELEARLRQIDEPVDLLIARFAWRYLSSQRRVSDPVFNQAMSAMQAGQSIGLTHRP